MMITVRRGSARWWKTVAEKSIAKGRLFPRAIGDDIESADSLKII
jgi:hypothetical protein